MRADSDKARARLVEALETAKAPAWMIDQAKEGIYGDFTSPLATPIMQLVADAITEGLDDIAARAMDGDFDG